MEKFKKGDKVRLINLYDRVITLNQMSIGEIYTVARYIQPSLSGSYVFLEGYIDGVYSSCFELVDEREIVPNPIDRVFVRIDTLEELEAYEAHCKSVGFKYGIKYMEPADEFNTGHRRVYKYEDNWEAWVLNLRPGDVEVPFKVFALLKGITVYKKATPAITELTLYEIAEKLGIPVETLKIKK
jgi:hypothetical protein